LQDFYLKDMDICQLSELFKHLGEPQYRAKQAFKWVNQEFVDSIDAMTNLPKSLREKLHDTAELPSFNVVKRQKDNSDGTINEIYGTKPDATLEASRYPTTYPSSDSKEALNADPWVQWVLNH
jgi:23S rRNA (adenine2503-C2)-methyltransferase